MFPEDAQELAEEREAELAEQGREHQTMLLGYFELNRQLGPEEAARYTYLTVGYHFYWDRARRIWIRRQRRREKHLIRLGSVGASNSEAQVINGITVKYNSYL